MMLSSIVFVALAAGNAFAFPSLLSEAFVRKRNAEPATVDSPCFYMNEMVKRQAPGVTPPFDAATQYVSNQGAHAFVAPGPTDQRGPCQYHLIMDQFQCSFDRRSWSERNGQPWVSSSQWSGQHPRLYSWYPSSLWHGYNHSTTRYIHC